MKSFLIIAITCSILSQRILATDPFQKGINILSGNGSSDLQPIKNKSKDVKAFTYIDNETQKTGFMAVARLEMPVSHAMRLVLDMKLRQKWDKIIYDYKVIGQLNNGAKICYWKVKMPAILTDREFLVESNSITQFGGYDLIVMTNSIDEHSEIPESHKLVRGEMRNTYIFVKQLEENLTEVSYLIEVDPKGKITPAIYDLCSKKIPYEMVENMTKGYTKHKELIENEGDNWQRD